MSVKVIVPCRFSFLHCWEPVGIDGSEPKDRVIKQLSIKLRLLLNR